MHKSFFNFEFKSVEIKDGKVKIKGFASTPDIDRYDDIVDTKAFDSSISTYMKNPIILLQHDAMKPIGKCIDYKLDEKGLEITAEISENTDGVIEKLNNKVLGAFSIGFVANKWEMTERTINGEARQIREIKDIDLVEISVVSTPANPQAVFTITKSLKKLFDSIESEEKDTENLDSSNQGGEPKSLLQDSPIENTEEGVKTQEGAIPVEIEGVLTDEKDMKSYSKMMVKKEYFEEKRVMLSGELAVGNLVRYTKYEYNMWDGMVEQEVEQGEIIKILENEDVTNPTIYILEYELTLDGFVPSKEMVVLNFRESTFEKISKVQLKEIETEALENAKQEETQTIDEIIPETVTPETVVVEDEVVEEVAEVPEVDIAEEVEKHFQAKAVVVEKAFDEKLLSFNETMEAKFALIEAKEQEVKSLYNETLATKKLVDETLLESKKIMERLLKIVVKTGTVSTHVAKAYNPYSVK